jgi:hypothetical protein
MSLDWILSPLAIYGAMALTMVSCLTLFLSFKFEVRQVRRHGEASKESLVSQVREMESSMGNLQEKVEDIGGRPALGTPAMNLNRRVQVLRMHRRGESLETIAAALSTPRNEVELLIRVQRMMEGQNQ